MFLRAADPSLNIPQPNSVIPTGADHHEGMICGVEGPAVLPDAKIKQAGRRSARAGSPSMDRELRLCLKVETDCVEATASLHRTPHLASLGEIIHIVGNDVVGIKRMPALLTIAIGIVHAGFILFVHVAASDGSPVTARSLLLIFLDLNTKAAAPSFAIFKEPALSAVEGTGTSAAYTESFILAAVIQKKKTKSKAHAVESCLSHPFQNRERDGAAGFEESARKIKDSWMSQPLIEAQIIELVLMKGIAKE